MLTAASNITPFNIQRRLPSSFLLISEQQILYASVYWQKGNVDFYALAKTKTGGRDRCRCVRCRTHFETDFAMVPNIL